MIHVQDLRKSYLARRRASGVGQALASLVRPSRERIEALRGVSFTIDRGEIVGYIGPNGAGKSTTIKVMCGILVPDSGSCVIKGRVPWKERAAHVAGIGVVFGQRSQLWWDVPVIDSFELLRDIYRVPLPEYRSSLEELTSALDLSGLLESPARSLSLGQRMRCELAASLLHRPDIIFLDEPTIGLDAVSKLAVRAFIERANRERGVTVILTTHDMHDIEALVSRVILIGKGEILYDGDFEALVAGGRATGAGIEAVMAGLYGEMGIA
jgi:ABC-2 type transport system ATP-binding protein